MRELGEVVLDIALPRPDRMECLTYVRPPVNPPAEACGGQGVPGSGPVVVAAGASMTGGRSARTG
ncbi:hypothetical protein [Saccharothrix luteola]|uniref:hypothetical protein n=1 Tax=Saccharothrix luteola TaxID=2893018 RepID=UPI001E5DBFA0|nr:hypothetical protein [Saccharothrix luteola]MCC8246994.1 hypothetical protein [Saccharothrix luteola]